MPEGKKSNRPVPGAPAAPVPPQAPPPPSAIEPKTEFVMMKRITDGDGPHPIHPAEVENYRRGDWVEVAEGK